MIDPAKFNKAIVQLREAFPELEENFGGLQQCLALRLPAPHDHIYITTPSPDLDGQIESQLRNLNDPTVYMQLLGPPFPYTLNDSIDWSKRQLETCQGIVEEWSSGSALSKQKEQALSGCCFVCLRAKVDGRAIYIGDITLRRHDWCDYVDGKQRDQLKETNDALLVGDPNIVYGFGFWLDPAYQGQGIGTSALRFLLNNYWIPYVKVENITSSAYVDNWPSRKVQERAGMVYAGVSPRKAVCSPAKGGGEKSIWILKWHRSDPRNTQFA